MKRVKVYLTNNQKNIPELKKPNDHSVDAHHLTEEEQHKINEKVEYEIVNSHYKMITLGGITNIISGIFVLAILYAQVKFSVLVGWYIALALVNVINIWWAVRHRQDIEQIKTLRRWRKIFGIIFAFICLTWGSMSVLFITQDFRYQLFVLAFLLAVLIGFSFSSITDFNLAVISIFCLLFPSILFYSYLGLHNLYFNQANSNINLGIAISLLILGAFLIIVSKIGSKMVNKFFQLSFTNIALSHKLENLNRFLEERVKERTLELEKSLRQVTYQASHDLLTNLPNHRSLINYMKKAIVFARKQNHLFAVVFFSLNEIDRIYNALGHQAGDTVIQTVASRFQEKYSEPSEENIDAYKYIVTLSRKDVFVIIMQPLYTLDNVEELAEPLFEILEKPIYTEKQVIKLTTSMGISVYPRNGRDITSLLMNADAAMLLAKQPGGNSIKMYKSEINAAITKQLELESSLHTALLKTEFILQYQPFIDLSTGQITGAEALVRWENPTLGRIAPDNFIPLAEANGIIIPLGDWVFRCACSQLQMWHQQGFKNLKIAINLSAKQLHYKFIIQSIINILKEINLGPEFIELELTETTAFQEEVIPILRELKEMGFALSIDDFGTGYSGLHNLKLIALDKIKIDKSFVQDVTTSNDSRAIVSNTIALAKKINVTVVAEGVETKEQLEFLKNSNCDVAQGYLFSPPVDPDVFLELVKSRPQFISD